MAEWNSKNFLERFPRFGQGLGLHRMLWLLEDCFEKGDMPTVKVTGSNGKGSVCAMLDAVLGQLGFTRGLYTSPHLLRVNERIQMNGTPIGDSDLNREIAWLQDRTGSFSQAFPGDRIGGFEALTAVGYRFFRNRNPRVLLLEAGIGGRFDAIRPLPGSWVVLTSLDLEHTELLGRDLESICFDKIDLCPEGGTLVLGNMADLALLTRIRYYCRLKKIRLLAVDDRCRLMDCRYRKTGMLLRCRIEDMAFEDLELGLWGRHQAQNALTALLCLTHFLQQRGFEIVPARFSSAAHSAFRDLRLRGRLERVLDKPPVFIDVAHTPAAVEALVQAVRELLPGEEILLVTGGSENKNVEAMSGRLALLASEIVCTRAYHRGAPVARVAAAVHKFHPECPCHRAETIEEAVAKALDLARQRNMTVLVAGGLFLAVEARETLAGRDPQWLRFF